MTSFIETNVHLVPKTHFGVNPGEQSKDPYSLYLVKNKTFLIYQCDKYLDLFKYMLYYSCFLQMAEEANPVVEEHKEGEEEEDNPNYKPPAPKSLDEIVSADAEDESLRKYKEALLGGAGVGVIIGE